MEFVERNTHRQRLAGMADSAFERPSAAKEMPTIVIIGDAIMDVQVSGLAHLPDWGKDRECQAVGLLPGGSAANVARQLGSIGAGECSVAFFSTVGDDELGQLMLRTMCSEGVLVEPRSTVRVLENTPQSTCIVLSGPSDRAMVTCYASVRQLTIAPFVGHPALERAAIVHISGYFNCTGLHDDETLAVLAACRARGALLSLDPQYDCTEAWTGRDGHLARLLTMLDIFLPNEVEACGLTGASTPDEALNQLAARYPSLLIILSVGAEGALAARGAQRWQRAALTAPFVDATGAGDAFDAGCLLSLLRSGVHDVEAALAAGVAAGAIAIGTAGACQHPMRRELFEAVLREGSSRLALP